MNMPAENTQEPTAFMRLGAVLLYLLALHSAYIAIGSWFEYRTNPLPVSKFIGIGVGIKVVCFTVLALLFNLPWRPLVYLLGNRPFHVANTLTTLLLGFAVGAPILVRLTNRPYDLISDTALVVIYYGYFPLSLMLWIASLNAVIVVWSGEEDIGRRPGFWMVALAAAPIICTGVWLLRILQLH